MLSYGEVKSVVGSSSGFDPGSSIVSGPGIGFTGANCKSCTTARSIFVQGSKTWVLYSLIALPYLLTSLCFLLKASARLFDFLARYISLKWNRERYFA
jgi:hypothetical protein